MALKFFHLQRHKTFNINPRYYDPDKEEQDDREQRIKAELGIKDEAKDNANFKPNLRGQFRYSLGRSAKSTSDGRRSSNVRLIILIIILSLLVYLFFYA